MCACHRQATTLELEWRWLAQATGKHHYAELVTRVSDIVRILPKPDHQLVPYHIDVDSGEFSETTLTLGAVRTHACAVNPRTRCTWLAGWLAGKL